MDLQAEIRKQYKDNKQYYCTMEVHNAKGSNCFYYNITLTLANKNHTKKLFMDAYGTDEHMATFERRFGYDMSFLAGLLRKVKPNDSLYCDELLEELGVNCYGESVRH